MARLELLVDDFNHGDLRVTVYDSRGAIIHTDLYLTHDWTWYIDGEYMDVDFTDSGKTGIWTIVLSYYEFTGDVHLTLLNTEESEPDDEVPPPSEYSSLLDDNFGSNGQATYAPGIALGKRVALDSQNRIVVAGTMIDSQNYRHLAIWRFLADGQLDTSFSNDGFYYYMDTGTSIGTGLVIDDSDRIIVSGWIDYFQDETDLVVLRLTSAGVLDTSFGLGGKVTIDDGDNEIGAAVATDDQGKILVTGSSRNDQNTTGHMILARYSAAGALDSSFGYGGIVRTSNDSDRGWDLVIEPSNRPIVMGARDKGLVVWRYTTTGNPDTSFSGDGEVTSTGGTNEIRIGRSISLKNDGTIAVAGLRLFNVQNVTTEMAVWQILSNGNPDTSFNGTGFLAYRFPDGSATGTNVEFDSSGRILVIGTTQTTGQTNSDESATLWRYFSNGALDPTLVDSHGSGVTRYDVREGDVSTGASSIAVSGAYSFLVTGGALDHSISAVDLMVWKLIP